MPYSSASAAAGKCPKMWGELRRDSYSRSGQGRRHDGIIRQRMMGIDGTRLYQREVAFTTSRFPKSVRLDPPDESNGRQSGPRRLPLKLNPALLDNGRLFDRDHLAFKLT